MKWNNYTFEYLPMTEKEVRAHRTRVLVALEKIKFKKPIGRFNVRRLWFLFQYVQWNPFRRQISIPEAFNTLAETEEQEGVRANG